MGNAKNKTNGKVKKKKKEECCVKSAVLHSSGRVTCFCSWCNTAARQKQIICFGCGLTAFTRCELFSNNPKPVCH